MGKNYSKIRTAEELQTAIDALRLEKYSRKAALERFLSESQEQLRPGRIIKETLQRSVSGIRWSSLALTAVKGLKLGLGLIGGRKSRRLRKVTK